MQRALTVGLALVCVCLLFAMTGPSAQRMINGDGGGSTTTPVPVAVNNFPAVQTVQGNVAVDKTVTVTGSVAVTNLPAVQQVAGTVNVGNLPVAAHERAFVVPVYYCQLTGTLAGDGSAQLNHGTSPSVLQGFRLSSP